MISYFTRLLGILAISSFGLLLSTECCFAVASMNDYCNIPPFVSQSTPPLVMLDVGRDHKLYYQAYNDAADLDSDGMLDIEYTHSIDYYGYFDSYKCYEYDTSNKLFNPVSTTSTKFCSSTQWSGNVLNWLTMTRMDALKKVLYGGHRSTDTATNTILQRVYVPNDAHSWGKELTGKLCNSGTVYKQNCSVNADCDSGYTCQDTGAGGKYLVPFAAATAPTTCTAVSPSSVNPATVLVARYKHSSSKTCNVGNSAGMVASYEPGNLFSAPDLVTYIGGFEDASLDPGSDHWGSNYNILATTTFTADATGTWWFAVDGDDDVEVQVGPAGIAAGGTVVAQYLGCHGASGGQSHNGSIYLEAGHQYTLVARHFEAGGGEGVRVWFKRPPTTDTITSTTSTSTTSSVTYKNSGTIAAATTACTALSGVLTGGKTSTGMCTSSKKCACTVTTTTTVTTPSTPTCPTSTTLLISGSTYTCTPNNWKYVTSNSATTGSTTGLYAPLSIAAPDIVAGNECAIMSTGFIADGIPQAGTSVTIGGAQRHLFCSTTAGSATPADEPILRVLTNRPERIWAWSAKEGPVCDSSLGTPTDFSVRVKVCDSALPETNCKTYGTSHKPTGLLHKYGEGDGSKVCSKNLSKTCNTAMNVSTDCATGEGLCVYRSPMYFGMMSGSYTNNTQGAVLRKNLTSFQEEINPANGIFSGVDGIINTFDKFRITTFSSGNYSCGWITNGAINNGQCNDWGNPMGEILYETLRYFSGKGTANTDFTYGTGATLIDNILALPKPTWGFTKDSVNYQPYNIYPSCSRPFALILSDINPSYDGDQIPGSAFTTYTEDALTPQLNIGAAPSTASGLLTYNATSLLRAMTNLIGTNEGMNSNDWFVGQSSSTNSDSICTSKTITDLSLVKGMCPEEPTKLGTYYLPALAYYGKTQLKANTGIPNMDTFAVALASPVADLKVKVGGNFVTIAPTAKSVSGCLGVYNNCANKFTFPAYDVTGTSPSFSGKGLVIPSSTTAFCPTNQIVNFFVDDIRYDGTDVVYANFRINYEDVEQGADHDMDAIVKYEVCTSTARTNSYGTCGDSSTTPALAANQFQIKMNSEYASGCIDQVMGFTLSGTGSTSTDGVYLLIKDGDVGGSDGDTPAIVAGMPAYTSRIFTASGTASGFLNNPLWFAAKWGGFTDGNNNKIPDSASEWAKNDGINPDNYYLVVNPLRLEQQLDKAMTDILKTTSSGTAASIVNNSGEAGTNMLQAVFYPKKQFVDSTISWIGEMQNMWFYLDPYLNANAIREDTVADKILDMNQDYKVTITFDADQSKTVANRFTNKGAFLDQIELDSLSPLWRAGELLYLRTTARTLKTSISGTSLMDFADANKTTLKNYLQAADDPEAAKIINWVHGVDTTSDTTLRSRSVSYNSHAVSPWRLGDIISSTPKVQPSSPMQGYDLDYNDLSYKKFWMSNNYKRRGMVYVGANDGMLHAFKLGLISKVSDVSHPTQVAKILPNDGTLGQEEWAYIPKNALPYLKYMMQPDYSHLYTVDATSRLIDVSIAAPSNNPVLANITCTDADYWNCTRATTLDTANVDAAHTADLVYADTSWRTVLIGGMGLGGASRPSDGACAVASDCVKAPIVTPTGYENVGLSSYFALDVSEPTTPSLMWEFTDSALGYTLTPPAILRINGKKGGAGADKDDPDKTKNGRWFAVFGSGPTGPINTSTHQFYGKSDQNLKLFIVDLKTGTLLRTIDTGVSRAFAGSLSNYSSLDTDFWDATAPGNYSNDVVYIGYSNYDTGNSRWDGGIYRLVTHESTDPANWTYSKVIDGVGPVTTAVSSLQDRPDKKLWLYFGGGRYFYKDNTGIDDADADPGDTTARRYIYGIKEPCYPQGSGITAKNAFDPACTSAVTAGSLVDQSDDAASALSASATGWKIKLSGSNGNYKSERLLTNPSASYNGNVTYTTFMPTADICGYGGQTFVWVVRGMSGSAPLASSLKGKLILQLSTGAFETVDLKTALTGRQGRRTGTGNTSDDAPTGGFSGGTSKDTPPEQKPPKGVPRILQIRER